MKTIAKISFKSPINIDNGHVNTPQGEHESTMELYHGAHAGVYGIEWIVDALDMVEHIGIFCSKEDKVVDDYDGVFELPRQAIDMLKANGFTAEDIHDWYEYKAVWTNTEEAAINSYDPKEEVVEYPFTFFSTKNGYTRKDIDAIFNLKAGQTWACEHGNHTVTAL